jgi:TnpA family transposase
MPRIKDLSDQWPFKLDRNQLYGELDCRFDATVSQDLIAEQWDQMACLTVSVKNRLAPPKLVVERLAGTVPADRLAKALNGLLGKSSKTIHIPRYIHDEKLRRAVQMQLNRGEARHTSERDLRFAGC